MNVPDCASITPLDLDTSFLHCTLLPRDESPDHALPTDPTPSSVVDVSQLTPQTIARIFAFLDPISIVRCGSTCRAWRAIASLDTTWRAAFMVASGLEEREHTLHEHINDPAWSALRVAPALRRMEPSWRGEYVARSALLRRWRKSRTPTVLTDPRIGTLSVLALSASRRFVLSLSNDFSVASRSNTHTGKVAKDFLDAHGFSARTPNGHPNIDLSPTTTAQATDAYASQIVWGLASGDISLTTLDWRGQSARGTIHNRAFPAGHAHSAPVTAIGMTCAPGHGGVYSDERHRQQLSMLGELYVTFATAAADGSVYVWHPKHMEPLWSGTAAHHVTHLAYAPAHGILAAARLDGTIIVWQNVCVRDMLAERHNYPAPQRIVILSGRTPVSDMVLDASGLSLLVHHKDARVFLRHTIGSQVRTAVFGAPTLSAITCLRCDFDIRAKPPPLPTALLARMQASRLQEHKFVCAGTASGCIGVWEWDDDGEVYDEQAQVAWQGAEPAAAERQVRPALVIEAHHTAITALAFSPLLLFAGCEDGTIKALDAFTGSLVRVFNERAARRHPARMLAAGELTQEEAVRFRVTHMMAADDMFVAAIGMHILSWHTDSEPVSQAPRTAPRRSKASVPERTRLKADFVQDVEEGQHQVRMERDKRASSQAQRAALESSVHGALDEDVALDYALMLSQQEASGVDDDWSPELMYDLETHEGDSDATPLSPPLVPVRDMAPISRAWDILCTAGRSASTTTSGDSHPSSWSKLQTVAVPRHARFGSPEGSLSSMSSSLTGSLCDWPDMRADNTRPSRSPHSLGAWAKPSPTLRAVDSVQAQSARRAGKSALVAERTDSRRVPPLDDDMDDDTRLALELSLAEYRSLHE